MIVRLASDEPLDDDGPPNAARRRARVASGPDAAAQIGHAVPRVLQLGEDDRYVSWEALSAARYSAEWYRRDVEVVARELIGAILVHRRRAGIIVETEAYGGPHDLASHARFGPTKRTSVMFGPGGFAYVYICYGIHEMMNIVTGETGQGQAVLVRAIAPYAGLPNDPAVGRGPGKVTIALGIDRRQDRKDLTRGSLYASPGPTMPPQIASGPRVGVDYAGAWASAPLRFWWAEHPSVSRAPTSSASSRKRRATDSSPKRRATDAHAQPVLSRGDDGSGRTGSPSRNVSTRRKR